MRLRPFVLTLSLLLLGADVLPRTGPEGPVVRLSSGSIRGSFQGQSAVFKGIPYAAPPVGDLRWREPQPVSAWTEVRDATQPGNACVQDVAGLDAYIQPIAAAYGASYEIQPVTSSEDCLYLNVWAPSWPPRGSLPVMVWLHGGSNRIGSGSETTYDGSSLAAHGVIIVSINYRLGILGFFNHPDLAAESPHHSSGNYGLLDQLAALRWVKDNIGQFGGDPENVTLFGESAGAVDAGLLMTSPLSVHLFRRVISESGPPFGLGPVRTRAEAEATGVAIAKLAVGTSPSPLVNLRKLPATDLVKLVNERYKGPNPADWMVDGWVFPQPPAKIYASGGISTVDLMVGLNGREMSAFRVVTAARVKNAPRPLENEGPVQVVRRFADAAYPLYGGWTYAAIAKYLFQALFDHDRGIDQAANDMLIACPLGAMATLTAARTGRVYVYKFDRAVPGKGESALGAFHGLEIPYVFHAFQDRTWQWLPVTEVDKRLSGEIQAYWTNFAKAGDPNSPSAATWPAWDKAPGSYIEFSPDGTPVPRQGFAPPFCDLSLDRLRQQLSINK